MMEPAEFSLFAGVDPGEVPKLLARFDAHEESFEKGELLFREGDVPHEVGLVLSGVLHVMQDDFWGNASIVSEVGEGDLFGASSACDPVPALDTHGLALVPTRALYLDTGRILNPPPGAPACHVRALANFARMLAGKYAALNRKKRPLRHPVQPPAAGRLPGGRPRGAVEGARAHARRGRDRLRPLDVPSAEAVKVQSGDLPSKTRGGSHFRCI